MQQRQLALPPHKGAPRAARAPRDARVPAHQPLHGVDPQRRRPPLQRQAAAGRPPHLRLHQVIRRRTHQERPGRRLLLEPQGALRGWRPPP